MTMDHLCKLFNFRVLMLIQNVQIAPKTCLQIDRFFLYFVCATYQYYYIYKCLSNMLVGRKLFVLKIILNGLI